MRAEPDQKDTAELEIRGEKVRLFAERAAYLPARGILLAADPHFGKDLFFRKKGFPVPAGGTEANLARMSALLERTRAKRLCILGDFLHAREGVSEELVLALREWREKYAGVEMALIAGNHDRHAGDLSKETGIGAHFEPLQEGPFLFAHEPAPKKDFYVFAGHLHPSVRLVSPVGDKARLPCFWFTPEYAVLPSFGDFTGSFQISPAPGDRVFAAAPEGVYEAGISTVSKNRPG